MENSLVLITFLSSTSSLTNHGLTLYLIENFGTLANKEQIQQESNGPELIGDIPDAIAATSVISICLSIVILIYILTLFYKMIKNKQPFDKQSLKISVLFTLLLIVMSTVIMSLHLVQEYSDIPSIVYSPIRPVEGEAYKIDGPFENALFVMSILSILSNITITTGIGYNFIKNKTFI